MTDMQVHAKLILDFGVLSVSADCGARYQLHISMRNNVCATEFDLFSQVRDEKVEFSCIRKVCTVHRVIWSKDLEEENAWLS